MPDRLEITIGRAASGACTLVYREFFTYLPPDVLELAMGNAVEFLGGLGVPRTLFISEMTPRLLMRYYTGA